jgi:hypothetical protein
MLTYDEFKAMSNCVKVGSRILATVNGKRNVDVGTSAGSSYVLNKTGEKFVADYIAAVSKEIEDIAVEHNAAYDAAQAAAAAAAVEFAAQEANELAAKAAAEANEAPKPKAKGKRA